LFEGTLFIYVWAGLALGIAVLLAWRSVLRALREPSMKWTILVVGTSAIALWVAASYFAFLVVFGTVWGLAHDTSSSGFFPEGWPIYGFLGAYTTVGISLVVVLGKLPRKNLAI
jgi:hypothetical protein